MYLRSACVPDTKYRASRDSTAPTIHPARAETTQTTAIEPAVVMMATKACSEALSKSEVAAPASVPDAPPENIAALVTMAAVLSSERPRAPRAVVDQRGWIDVWELRRDVAQVEGMKGSERAAAGLSRARRALNAAWLPALKEAMAKGDPVAEVILRTCNTSFMLDRTGIEADCSADPAQKELARRRLESIGFVPALGAYTREELRSLARDPAAALYERMIDAMEKGDLGAASVGAGNPCPLQNGKKPSDDPRFLRCDHLYRMSRAIGHEAKWFFTPAPLEKWRDEKGPSPSTSNVVDADAFRKERSRRLRAVDASVAAYLRKEPRWAVFLMERDGETVRFAVPPKAPTGSS